MAYVLQQLDNYLLFIRVLANSLVTSEQGEQLDLATEEYRAKVRAILQGQNPA